MTSGFPRFSIHGFSASPIRAQLRLLDNGGIRYDICEASASCISWTKKTWDSHVAAVVWPSSLHGCRFWFWRSKALFNVKLFCKFHIVPRLNRVDFAIGFLTQPPLSRVTELFDFGQGAAEKAATEPPIADEETNTSRKTVFLVFMQQID